MCMIWCAKIGVGELQVTTAEARVQAAARVSSGRRAAGS